MIDTVSKACEPVSHCKGAEQCVGCVYYPVWAGTGTSSQLCTVSSDSEGSELDYRKYLRFAKISQSRRWSLLVTGKNPSLNKRSK